MHSNRIYKMSLNVTQGFNKKIALTETLLKTDKNYANNLKHKRIKKTTQSISLAILFAVPFAISFLKQNLQIEKYNCQR